jgi:ZIP family zinc transporter
MHGGSPTATLVGGALGVLVILLIKKFEERAKGPIGLLSAVGVDILVDGLVLGLAFIGGQKAGLLLTIALTVEILFLGLTVTNELSKMLRARWQILAATIALALLLPVGTLIASPVSLLPAVVVTGFLSFGLMALLYLVTEELLVEAHEKPDNVWITAAFFVGFLALLAIEELIG